MSHFIPLLYTCINTVLSPRLNVSLFPVSSRVLDTFTIMVKKEAETRRTQNALTPSQISQLHYFRSSLYLSQPCHLASSGGAGNEHVPCYDRVRHESANMESMVCVTASSCKKPTESKVQGLSTSISTRPSASTGRPLPHRAAQRMSALFFVRCAPPRSRTRVRRLLPVVAAAAEGLTPSS